MKKIISVFLCLCMVISTFSLAGVSVFAEANSGQAGEGVIWSLNGDKMTVSGSGHVYSGDWSDEQKLATKSIEFSEGITGVSLGSFVDFTSLESVTFADSVETVDYNAFSGATSLKSVTVGKNFSSRFGGAFNGYPSLDTIVISEENSLYKVVDGVVYRKGVSSLEFYPPAKKDESFIIPDTIDCIYASAFSNNKYIKSVTIHDRLTDIYDRAFENCTALATFTGGNYISYIDANAIDNTAYYNDPSNWEDGILYIYNTLYKADNANLPKKVVIKENVNQIAGEAFYECTNLESITLSDNITEIMAETFRGCSSLKEVVLNESLSDIGQWAFEDCTSLESINLPKNVGYIASDAFMGCSKLSNISVDENNEYFSATDGILFDKDKKELFCYPKGKQEKSFTVPSSVEIIEENAFNENSYLEEVIIGDNVLKIGYCAFEDCVSLKKISLGNNVEIIESYAFDYCGFYDDPSNWENGAFYIGKYLISVDSDCEGKFTIKEGTELIAIRAFEYCEDITDISIPDSVKYINYCAFENCGVYDNSANWENGALYIDNYLIKVDESTSGEFEIKEGVKVIADNAFEDSAISSVEIPDSVEYIGNGAFEYCTSLESVTIPDSVKYLGESAFEYCSNLKDVKIGKGITKIKKDTFYCVNIESIIIPEGVTEIEESAFCGCFELNNVSLPDSLEIIGKDAFNVCNSLNSIIIPDNVKKVGENAFTSTTKIIVNPDTPVYKELINSGARVECAHKFVWKTTKKSTHFAKGKKVYKCLGCGEVIKSKNIAKLKFTKKSSKLTAAKKSIKIKYKKVKYATGIRVRYKTAKGKWKYITFNTTKSATKKIKNLKSRKKYRVQVQAVRKVKGKKALYSNWTAIRTVKVK